MTRALITGVTGQDGSYLSKLLLDKGYQVWGGCGPEAEAERWRLRELGLEESIRFLPCDLTDTASVRRAVEEAAPDEIYNLAALSAVTASFEQPLRAADVNASGVLRLLEAVRRIKPDTRVFQASSCEMFGQTDTAPQDEATPFRPRSLYGVAKLFAHWTIVNYRDSHGVFACSGILFNHESPFRDVAFVTRKISDGVARIRLGRLDRLTLGNIAARRDWGYAADYVEGMWSMLQHAEADDYVIATGEAHTVREFAAEAFLAAGIEVTWQGAGVHEKALDTSNGRVVAEVSAELFRLGDVGLSIGNAGKAKKELGWAPRTGFTELVAMMVQADLRRLSTSS